MTCQHSNPIGYIFCSTCGQYLAHKSCRCGFVCSVDALYCGRCGHSLSTKNITDDSTKSLSAESRRYDLDLMVELAGQHSPHKKDSDRNAIKIDQKSITRILAIMKKDGEK